MNKDVDLRELAVDRGGRNASQLSLRNHFVTRYVLPLMLLIGFAALLAWAARDLILPAKPVRVVPVYSTAVEIRTEGTPQFQAAGWIEPRPTPIRVAALAPGVVEQLLVVEDQFVEAGEPIAVLVKADAELARDAALADLELRQAELDQAQASLIAAQTRLEYPVHIEAAVSESEALLASTNTQLNNLPFELRRAEAEFKGVEKDYKSKQGSVGVVSEVETAIARSKLDAAKAWVEELQTRSQSLIYEQNALTRRRDAVRTQLKLLANEKQALQEAKAKVRAAEARIKQANVVLSEANLRRERMTIVAPVTGRVFQLIAHPGANLSVGMGHRTGHDSSTVVTMYRPTMLQVRVDVRFGDLPNIELGQRVEIKNPALQSPLTGIVLFSGSEADIQKNTLQVKVDIADPPDVIKPEMLVDVTFLSPGPPEGGPPEGTSTIQHEMRTYVPTEFVYQDETGSFVWIADQSDQIARKQRVELGPAQSDDLVEISKGLNISQRIISSSADGLVDGDHIRITGEDVLRDSPKARRRGNAVESKDNKTVGGNQ